MSDETVIPFKRHEPEPEKEVTLSGDAVCTECGHRWVQVSPEGTRWFDCPKCHVHRGTWAGFIAPADGYIWRCNCKNELFVIRPSGVHCAICGTKQSGF